MELNKGYECFEILEVVKPCCTILKDVDMDDTLKTQRYYEFILRNSNSLKIKHKLAYIYNPDRI